MQIQSFLRQLHLFFFSSSSCVHVWLLLDVLCVYIYCTYVSVSWCTLIFICQCMLCMVSLSSARLHLTQSFQLCQQIKKKKKAREKDVKRNSAALAASAFESENVSSYFSGPHRNAGISVGRPHLSSMMAINTFSAPCEWITKNSRVWLSEIVEFCLHVNMWRCPSINSCVRIVFEYLSLNSEPGKDERLIGGLWASSCDRASEELAETFWRDTVVIVATASWPKDSGKLAPLGWRSGSSEVSYGSFTSRGDEKL